MLCVEGSGGNHSQAAGAAGENAKVLVTQLCPTPSDPMDCSPPGSSVHGILQARTLGWVAIPFSRDLPYLGIEPRSHTLQADSLPSEQSGKPTWSLALRNTFVHFPNSFFGIPIS